MVMVHPAAIVSSTEVGKIGPMSIDRAWHTHAPSAPLQPWWRRSKPSGQRTKIAEVAGSLPEGSPLHPLLASVAFEERLAAHEAVDATAVTAQRRYKRGGSIALTLVTLATLIAAASLLPVSSLVPDAADRIVSGLQAASNMAALAIVYWLGRAGAIDRWLSTRAEAERLRGRLFADLLAAPAPPGSDTNALWRDKLALVEGAHIDAQRDYFKTASLRHSKAAAALSWPRAAALLATGLAICIGTLAFFGLWPETFLRQAPWLRLAEDSIRWQLALGTLASALLARAAPDS
jgi:hypothetical protein